MVPNANNKVPKFEPAVSPASIVELGSVKTSIRALVPFVKHDPNVSFHRVQCLLLAPRYVGSGSSTAERPAARNGGSMIRSGPSRVNDCSTLISGR